MESRSTQAVLPLVGRAADKIIRDRYTWPAAGSEFGVAGRSMDSQNTRLAVSAPNEYPRKLSNSCLFSRSARGGLS
ncbi:MAG: hypothetical protein ACQESR_04110 [Planctomycetota bacterium]